MCWGDNEFGDVGDNSDIDRLAPVQVMGLTSGVQAVAAGNAHTCAVTTAGAVMCWGQNEYGQLGDNSTSANPFPLAVQGLSSGATSVTAGFGHSCAVAAGGAAMCWGDNEYAQLGNGTSTMSSVPVAVSGLSSGVVTISAGSEHTCVVTTAGAAECWGNNTYGQLGDGTTTASNVPVVVSGLSSGVASLSAGYEHTCVVTTAGDVECWGRNDNGELGNNTTTQSNVPVSVVGL
jgi:alpha-tubulin suppressor-like RCC1 family protein